ncbi:MAG TPA: alpha-amylase family protein [Bryobacteraceae bacterium]|nr:alpha-amylase family protein [Bryobacteraceae bacterium]
MDEPVCIDRRSFLAVSLAGAGLASKAVAQPAGGSANPAAEWYDRAMRWFQLILVEDNPGQYDSQTWFDLFRTTHTDGLCLTAGGCVAYYPTKIPFHHRSSWMKEGDDPFGQFVEGCRKLNMAIVARTDAHAILDDAAQAHPEWVAVDREGRKRRHWVMPDRWVTCAYGPYNFEFMTEVHRELVTLYGIDGLFVNRWQGSGICYCESCRRQFHAFCGKDIPTGVDARDPVFASYVEWTQGRLVDLWKLWDGELRKVNPHARYFSNVGLDRVTASTLAPLYISERQTRGSMPPWQIGLGAKEVRAVFGRKPVVGLASTALSARDSVSTEAELRVWMLDGIANGVRPWVMKTSAVITDRRWIPAVEKIYDWHWRNEKYLRNASSLARVAMVYSAGNRDISGITGAGGGAVNSGQLRTSASPYETDYYQAGMYHALVEARIPFDFVFDKLLDQTHLDAYKLLLLPNVTALSDAQCEQIRQFAARGGSVLATFETSLHDERGVERRDFGLSNLFGVHFTGSVQRQVSNSYMAINRETGHAILKDLETFGHIINTTQHVDVRAAVDFPAPPLTRIPSYPTLPMEEIFPREPKTNIPEVFLRDMGRSRIVYFPGDIDRTFWQGMAPDHGTLLRNAVEWALNEEHPVTVSGSGILDVACWRQENSLTVHLVNLTNPMMLRSAFRELLPVGQQRVSLRLPPGKPARAVRLLASGLTLPVTQSAGRVTFTIPSVLDHEVAAIDL